VRRIAGASIALCLAGCVEFVGPEEPGVPDLAAQVLVSAVLVDGGDPDSCPDSGGVEEACATPGGATTSVLAVTAMFFPGTDAEGWPRPVVTDTLRILDEALVPDEMDDRGWYLYSAQTPVPTPGSGGVVIPMVLPVAGPGAAQPLHVTVALPGRSGPDRIRLVRGENLILPLSPLPREPSPFPSFERWQLELTDGGPLFVVSSVGRPPAELFVPAVWIPSAPGGVVNAKLVLDQRVSVGGPEQDLTSTLMRVELKWTIEIEEPAQDD